MTEIKTEDERVDRCECEVCQYGREVRRHLAMLPEAARPFFESMYENLCYTENDLNYAQAVLDGSWPTAVPQLQRALDEAWKIARERGYDRDWPAPSSPVSNQKGMEYE